MAGARFLDSIEFDAIFCSALNRRRSPVRRLKIIGNRAPIDRRAVAQVRCS
jgi:hypothetical protein